MPLLPGVPRSSLGISGAWLTTCSGSQCAAYLLLVWLVFIHFTGLAHAQVTAISPTTGAGALGTIVTPSNGTTTITGGIRPNGGTNLFHSFHEFSVGTSQVANFLNETALPTASILSRVTGGQISRIYGTIQTTGFDGAHFSLMNPAGIVFGPSASLNVGGSVTFTTADYLRLMDGARFEAAPGVQDAVLSAAPVAAFGFLGSNPGAITVQGSQLTVTEGTGISLMGGNIRIQSGSPDEGGAQPARLSAPNGKIQLASAASPGEFDAATLQPLPNVDNTSFTSFGSVSLASGSTINVSGEQTVSIRGGQFLLSVNDAVLSTAQSPGPPETISLSPGSSMISSNAGSDPGADVQLLASQVQMDGGSIQSLTTGEGAGGTISITAALDGGPISSTAGSVQMQGGQIQTASLGPGTVGDIEINSSSLSMTDGALIDTLLVPNPLIPGQPGGGTIAITATDSIFVTGQRPGTTDLLPSVPGLPTFTNMPSGIYSVNLSANTGSSIVIQTPSLTLQPGRIGSDAFGAGAAGDLSLLLGQLTLNDGGRIGSVAFGAGAGGSLQLRASDSITMSGFLPGIFQHGPVVLQNDASNIASGSFGLGPAGQVFVFTPTLTMHGAPIASSTLGPGGSSGVNVQAGTITMTGGATISSGAFGSGPGGGVSVTASEQLSISGHSGQSTSFGEFTVVNHASAISANTLGTGGAGILTVSTPRLTMFDGGDISTSTGGDGPGGAITVNAGTINLSSGASISSNSGLNIGEAFLSGNGAGGSVTLNATGPVTIADQGSGLFTTTVGNGAGGNIDLHGSAIHLSNGASISATSSGSGNAGNITINAGNQLAMTNSSVTTESGQASGGNIDIQVVDLVHMVNSTISASVQGGPDTVGGNIDIDPEFVILQNSKILARAFEGQGGNIKITAGVFMMDTLSEIDASSQFGRSGEVTIQSPLSNLSASWMRLQQSYLEAAALLRQACAARLAAGESSLILTGRERIPMEPGSWLSSPIALLGARAGGPVALSIADHGTTSSPLSLRGNGSELPLRRYGISPVFYDITNMGCGA